MGIGEPAQQQDFHLVAHQLRDDLVGARIIEAPDAGEIHHRNGPRGKIPLDVFPNRSAGGACHEVGVETGHGLLENGVHHDLRNHYFFDDPFSDSCSGMMSRTCDPGNAGNPSFSGTSSSQRGTIAMRAVPLRMATLPSQRARYRRIPASPCPRPGSRNRLTPWISAASSAAASPQRSPKRFACVGSSEWRNPTPASATAITTTRRASLRRQLYACTATHPPVPACSTIF